MVLGFLKRKQDPLKGKSREEVVEHFQNELIRHNDLLFGVGLYFECISLLYAGREDLVQTHRKQLRNILQEGQKAAENARELLARVAQDPGAIEPIRDFQFPLFEGHPQPEKMALRCEVLSDAYRKAFPKRPRSQDMNDDDVFALLQVAVPAMADLPVDA